jgi:hypothetical protein
LIPKRIIVVAVCVAVLMVAVGAYGYALYSEISSLKGQISLLNQELEELWEEIDALKQSNSTNNTNSTMNFTFTWGPETQDIVDEIFKIEVSVWFGDNTLPDNTTIKMFYIVVSVYDDDHSKDDYLGLVFDMNHNGVIDLGFEDDPLIIYGDDSTIYELGAVTLLEDGLLIVAEVPREPAHNKCVYNLEKGYVFGTFGYPASDITSQFEDMPAYIPVHICFADRNLNLGVHVVSFQFRIYL